MTSGETSERIEGLFDLSGKLAVVTGARRGIGRAIAELLAAAGADIIGVSAQLEDSGSEVQQSIEALGRSFEAVRADLSDESQVHELALRLTQRSRPIDVLVNNAGSIVRAAAVDHTDEMWARTIATNLTAPFILTREIGRTMIERGAGKVIFTSSLLSFQGGILVPSYTASKHGVAGLVKAFSNEWAAKGVNVNGIAPGYIATDNTEALRADPERSRSILDRIPAGRWGEALDIAGAALFLASSASDYVCGVVLPVDGGWLAR
ncbi:MAG: SDR family NAD(P)-dependent oxidoreductase [Acidimicrobiales bacterium]